MNVPVFMYHRIRSANERCDPSEYVVTEDAFRRQLNYLSKRGYRTPPLATALEHPPARSVLITFDDGYLDNHTHALPLLLELGFRATVFVVADRERRVNFWDDSPPTGGAKLMGPAQMREMSKAGVEIGSHGLTHRRLTELTDGEAMRELRESKEILEDLLGRAVHYFAYPFGATNERVKELARGAGYRAAFATDAGPFDARDDLFEIRRLNMGDRSDERYLFTKVSGLERAAECASSLWHRTKQRFA